MKYYTYITPDDDNRPIYHTYSEDDIIKEYWPYWYGKMCEKYGKHLVDKDYSYKECIEDWIIVHWAWESTNEQENRSTD